MLAKDLSILITKDGSAPYAENASGDILSTFNRAVLGQLLLMTDSYELKPGLLKNWKWNAKDNSYELQLREDLAFHDGTPVKAEDLEFALVRGFFTKQKSFYEIFLGNILGVEKIHSNTPYKSGSVEGVQIIGPLSVRVKLKHPNPSFLYSLTAPYFSFAKKDALNPDFITWKKWPIGAGDYKIVNEETNKLTLTRRSLYYTSQTAPETIHLFKKDDSKTQFDISFYATKSAQKEFYSNDPSSIATLFFTNQNPLALSSDFRKAIFYGVKRSEIVQSDADKRPALEFLPSNFWRNQNLQDPYDIEKAKAHFNKLPANLIEKTWRIPVFASGSLTGEKKKTAEILTSQFAKFGFKVEFYPSAEKFLSKESAAESPLKLSSRVCSNVDPLLMFSSFKSKSPYMYDNSQNDSEFDRQFEKAAESISTDLRVESLRKLSNYTISHQFMIPLYESLQIYYFNPETIKDFGKQTDPITLFLDQIQMK